MATVPVITVNNVPVPSVPVASENVKSLTEAVTAIKANVEALTGAHVRTAKPKSAIETAFAVAISRTENV